MLGRRRWGSGRQQMNDVVTTSSRNAAVERDEGPAVTTGQPEQVAVGDLLAGLRGSDFCHDRRRPWVGPELVRASVGSQEEQLIGCSFRQPGAAGQLAQTRMTPSSVTAQVAQL